MREAPKYEVTGREVGELKKIWKHLKSDMLTFKAVCSNYLSSRFVNNPSAKKLYETGVEPYKAIQTEKVKPLREYAP